MTLEVCWDGLWTRSFWALMIFTVTALWLVCEVCWDDLWTNPFRALTISTVARLVGLVCEVCLGRPLDTFLSGSHDLHGHMARWARVRGVLGRPLDTSFRALTILMVTGLVGLVCEVGPKPQYAKRRHRGHFSLSLRKKATGMLQI
jgi:hypothetical protein